MNVIVTGGLGFIGSNLVDILKEQGANVIVFDNMISESSSINYKRNDVHYIIEDAGKIQEWNHELPEKIDVIYHLAAHSRIPPSFRNPLSTIRNNIEVTSAICEFARHRKTKVVYAGTSAFYSGIYENPYVFTKTKGEEVCEMYAKLYGLEVSIARFFNVYGPREHMTGEYAPVVGIFLRKYRAGEDLTITGDGEQRRDFIHVNDICRGLIAISKVGITGTYNLGLGVNYSINELANMIINFGCKNIKKVYIPKRPGEARETLADISKTVKDTGWQPKEDLHNYLNQQFKIQNSIN